MEIVAHKNFRKRFKKLPPAVQRRYRERLNLFLINPFDPMLNNHAVPRAYPNCRSINITGDYRAVYYENGDTAVFITIGTHADLYQ